MPDKAYILSLLHQLRDEMVPIRAEDKKLLDLYWDRHSFLPEPGAGDSVLDIEEVRLRKAYDTIHRLHGIVAKPPQLHVTEIGSSNASVKKATQLENLLNPLFPQLEKEARSHVRAKAKLDALKLGRGYVSLQAMPKYWDAYYEWRDEAAPSLDDMEGGGEVVIIPPTQKTARKLQHRLPMLLQHLPVDAVFPGPSGDGGPQEYLIVRERRVKDVIAAVKADPEHYKAPNLEAWLATQHNQAWALLQKLEWIEYYDAHTYCYTIASPAIYGIPSDRQIAVEGQAPSDMQFTPAQAFGEQVYSQEHHYGMAPIVEYSGEEDSDRGQVSVLFPLYHDLIYLDKLASQKGTAIRTWAWYTLVHEVNPNSPWPVDADGRPEPLEWHSGEVNSVYAGDKVYPFTLGPLPADLDEQMQLILQNYDRKSIASVLYGMSGGDVSAGYAINSLRQAALTRWGTISANLLEGDEQLAQLALNCIKYELQEELVLYQAVPNGEAGQLLSLKPDDIPEKVYIQAIAPLKLDLVDDASMIQNALASSNYDGVNKPLLTRNQARTRFMDIENPDEVSEAVDIQLLLDSPELRGFQQKETLDAANVDLAPNEADEIRAILQLSQDPKLPPALQMALQQYGAQLRINVPVGAGAQGAGMGAALGGGAQTMPAPGGPALDTAQGFNNTSRGGQRGRAAGQSRRPGGPRRP